jgi:hypothetical protein
MRGIPLAITSVGILVGVVAAEARIVCRFASSCETAQKWCLARGNRAMSAANCEASFKACKATGVSHGYGPRGLFQCKVRTH